MRRLTLLSVMVVCTIFIAHMATGQVAKRHAVEDGRFLLYEGVLTDPSGKKLEGEHTVTFTIYDSPESGVPLWVEEHDVRVEDGEFQVILGKQSRIPSHKGTSYYIGISVDGENLLPRQPFTALSYDEMGNEYRTAPNIQSAVTPPIAIPYGAGGGWTDDGTVVRLDNANDFVGIGTATPGAKLDIASRSLIALRAENVDSSFSGQTYGGYFSTNSTDYWHPHYGLYAEGIGSSEFTEIYGSVGYAENSSYGDAYGGYFEVSSSGRGDHYGVSATASGTHNGRVVAVNGQAANLGTDWLEVFGGKFSAEGTGTGTRIGLDAYSSGFSSFATYGVRSNAVNTSSGDVYGGYFNTYSSGTGTHYGVYGVETAGGSGAAVYASGDMIASGLKPAVVTTPSSGHRLLYAVESSEVWFEDVDRGRLFNGKAHIDLDPLFLQTVTIDEDHPMEVFIQLRGDCNGTYVQTDETGFDVIELNGGTSHAPFSYRILAKRKGYEDERLRETDVGYDDPNLYPEVRASMERERVEEEERMASERQKREDERARREAESRRSTLRGVDSRTEGSR